jgi:putative GTP pyrophosphokinase
MPSTMKGIITTGEKQIIAEKMAKEEVVKQFIRDLKTFYLKYTAAMNETATKIEILNEDYKTRYDHSPIEHIESRIKEPESLIKKMMRNNLDFDINTMQNRIFDIAGVRVICSFQQDIYDIVDMINKNEEIQVIKTKDYIANPKESGYRSYHMILKVPVYLTTGREEVPVELQIRTMAMDFWASLEHKIKYKYDGIIPEEIQKELVECSNTIAKADEEMMRINNRIKEVNK